VAAEVSGLLGGISTRYGKYAVTGNHEYIAGLTQSLEHIRQFGFKLLRQEAVTVDNVLTIVGIDDPMEGSTTDETALLSSLESDRFILFLKHRPDVPEGSRGLFDLQLSGHTHRGQIFPFSLITGRVYPLQDGLYDLEKGSKLYTSRGSGTWGPPMRVLSPPEVTIIELVRDTGSQIKG
jgi:predicted MPP superfamily phosphohydrolase